MKEEILVTQLKEGSKEAFDELYEKYKNMAIHMAYLIGRRQKREVPDDEMIKRMESPTETSSFDKVIQLEEAEMIAAAVRALPMKLKTVVVLYYYDSFSVKEIAEMLGLMEGTVKSRLHTARKRMQRMMERQYEEGNLHACRTEL